MKATIHDVAKAAGVSPAMVSRVLTGRGYVRDDKKEKVLKVVKKLSYHPSAFAKGLRDGRTKTLGMVFSWISAPSARDYFYREILSAVLDECASRGYQLLLSNFRGRWDEDEGWKVRQLLTDERVEGVLLIAPRAPEKSLKKLLTQTKAQVMLLAHSEAGLAFVDADHQAGIEAALDLFASKSLNRVAFLGGEPALVANARSRELAFKAGIKRRGWKLDASMLLHGPFDAQSGEACMRSLMGKAKAPQAVIAASDLIGLGALKVIHELPKSKRPLLVSFDDRPEAGDAGMSSVRIDFAEIGRRGARELIGMIENGGKETPQIKLPVELIRRHSA